MKKARSVGQGHFDAASCAIETVWELFGDLKLCVKVKCTYDFVPFC